MKKSITVNPGNLMSSKKQWCSTVASPENNPKIKAYKTNDKHSYYLYKKAALSENTHNDWVENQTEKNKFAGTYGNKKGHR
ncbi:hypothetical protein KGP26_22440 [Serratia sp. JSRIV002]|uniref:hypothetical protein n=1 Tax=Serratia sp. JSRIV002 TaxID=2831894 RepID=UPI001CBAAB01|nr:hypothetical protein [Serratia sp. JSRIV002]UAN50463.1 hypothetical protein KGP26_22440 [Serratia sp. JSRIV002]